MALAGDGAFLMTGLELLTAAAYGAGVVVIVLRDRELAQIAQFQRTALNRATCSGCPLRRRGVRRGSRRAPTSPLGATPSSGRARRGAEDAREGGR